MKTQDDRIVRLDVALSRNTGDRLTTLQQLEADWRSQLQATARPAGAESARVATAATVETVETVGKLFESDANTACAAAQKLASRGR